MKPTFSLMQQFVGYTTVFTVGAIGVSITHSAIFQRSFAQTQPLQMAQSSPIEGSWRLANMTEPGSPMPMLPSKKLTADFVGDRVSGSGGCNRFSGGFAAKGNQLSVGPLASTFMACEPPIMQQETKYLTALQNAQRYEVSRDGLEIFYQTEKGTGVLRFTTEGVRALW